MHVYLYTCTIIMVQCIGIDQDTCDPAMMALQLCYSDIKTALDTHITVVASSCFSKCLVPAEIHSTIISSPSMPSGDKVNMFLKGARTYCIINEWHQAAAKECCDSIKPRDR